MLVLASALTVFAAEATVAVARAKTITYVYFKAEGEHGHKLEFYGRGSANAQRGTVTVEKGENWYSWSTDANGELIHARTSDGSTATQYMLNTVRRLSTRRIDVPMGDLGAFSAHFEPEGVKRVQRPCLSVAAFRGELSGRIRFEGEGGYAAVDEQTAKARVAVVHRTCRGPGRAQVVGDAAGAEHRYDPPVLIACGPDPGTLFSVVRRRYFADFSALKFERTPTARIVRFASAPRLARAFTLRRDLRSAKLRPRPPIFNGSALYRNQSLSGDLRTRFAGAGGVPLTPADATFARGDLVELPACPGVPNASGLRGRMAFAEGGEPSRGSWLSPPRPDPSLIAPKP